MFHEMQFYSFVQEFKTLIELYNMNLILKNMFFIFLFIMTIYSISNSFAQEITQTEDFIELENELSEIKQTTQDLQITLEKQNALLELTKENSDKIQTSIGLLKEG